MGGEKESGVERFARPEKCQQRESAEPLHIRRNTNQFR
jgi:hypothetical protein